MVNKNKSRQRTQRGKRGRKANVEFWVRPFTRFTDSGGLVATGTSSPLGTFSLAANGLMSWTLAATTSQYASFAMAFTLSDLPGYTEFTSLFDEYRINRVDLHLIPGSTTSLTPDTTAGAIRGFLHTAYDPDDINAPTASTAGIAALQQYETYRADNLFSYGMRPWAVEPRVALAAYSGAFTSYANEPAKWIDAGSPAVQHYGLKGVLEISNPESSAASVVWRWVIKFHLQMRTAR